MPVVFQVDSVTEGAAYTTRPTAAKSASRFCQDVPNQADRWNPFAETIEAYGGDFTTKPLVPLCDLHGFFAAAVAAFNGHRGLILKPDHFWQLIVEVASDHVYKNAEALRSRYVNHDGQTSIHVHRGDFHLGAPNGTNDWPSLFTQFSDAVKAVAKPEAYVAIVGEKFSTTTTLDWVARELGLMSTVRAYCNFSMSTMCGFPSITLLGEREDWVALRRCAAALSPFLMPEFAARWLPAVDACLAKFVEPFDGACDKLFWGSMVKYQSTQGSGADTYFTGWLNAFFPTREDPIAVWPHPTPSGFISWSSDERASGLRSRHYAARFTNVPVEVTDERDADGKAIKFVFKAGFVAASEDGVTGAIMPELGWAVLRAPSLAE